MSNHFLLAYSGNKRQEYKLFKQCLNFNGVNTIIEPFCGSAAVSYNIWLEHGDKFKYVLNDNDTNLFKLYMKIKEINPDEWMKDINELKNTIHDKDEYLKLFKKKNKPFNEWFIINKYYNIRPGLYDSKMHKKEYKLSKSQLNFIKFIKMPYVEITNEDWNISFNKYKNDESALIILDPPYLQSCNDFYLKPSINVYEYLADNSINDFKSNILLILENMWIIRLLFRDCDMIEYGKTYATTKKKTTHLCITN